jgi:DNA-binding MarR family transcriptional regulator
VACGYEPPTITISIRQLESLGLVERRPSQTDKRVTIVELTERGTELLAKVKAAWHDVAELTLAGLGRTSFKQLQTVLTDLAASLAATDQPTRYLHPPPPR